MWFSLSFVHVSRELQDNEADVLPHLCVNLHSAYNMQGVQTDDTSIASVDYNMCTAGTFIGSVVGSKLVQCSSFSLKMTALDELYFAVLHYLWSEYSVHVHVVS